MWYDGALAKKKWFRPDFGTTVSVSLSWFEWCHSQLWYRQPQDPIHGFQKLQKDLEKFHNIAQNWPDFCHQTFHIPRRLLIFTFQKLPLKQSWYTQFSLLPFKNHVALLKKFAYALGRMSVPKNGKFVELFHATFDHNKTKLVTSQLQMEYSWIGSWGCRYQSWEWHHSNQDNEMDTVVPKSGLNHFILEDRWISHMWARIVYTTLYHFE